MIQLNNQVSPEKQNKRSFVYLRGIYFILFCFLIAMVVSFKNVAAQPPDTLWTKTFGGSNIDIGHCVQQSTDGGYIITGYTRSYGVTSGRNVWLVKTDASGNQEWHNTFGGDDDDEGYSVQQTTDGGYIVAGHTKSFGAGMKDVLLIKTDSFGNSEWIRTFGGSSDDEGYSVQQTTDGCYIIGGVTSSFGAGSSDAWLIKTDAMGYTIWEKTHGGLSSDGALSVQQTSDGGYIFTGWTLSYGPGYLSNVWLVKTDSLGNQEWHRFFGGLDWDEGYSVQQTCDGGYIIAGETESFGEGLYDLLLIKTDSLGYEEWMKTFGGAGRDYGRSVQQTSDGGYIITGYTRSYGAGDDDVWLIKTDMNGNEEWSQTYGGTSSDVGYWVEQTSDGGYIITGHTLSYGAGSHDLWLIKTAAYPPTISETQPIITDYKLFQNHPNPFNPSTTIRYALPMDSEVKLVIYNVLGQKVRTLVNEPMKAGYHHVMWDGLNDAGDVVAPGIYIYLFETGDFRKVQKMILLK